jgi:hypothetical protein
MVQYIHYQKTSKRLLNLMILLGLSGKILHHLHVMSGFVGLSQLKKTRHGKNISKGLYTNSGRENEGLVAGLDAFIEPTSR